MTPSLLNRCLALVVAHAAVMFLDYTALVRINGVIRAVMGLEMTILFAVLPLIAVILCWAGHPRPGCILMLGSFPAAILININTHVFLPSVPPNELPAPYWHTVSSAAFIVVLALEVTGIVISYRQLRTIHAVPSAGHPPTGDGTPPPQP